MTFKNQAHHKAFSKDGFLLLPGFLKAGQIADIHSFYQKLPPAPLPFYTSNWIADTAYKQNIHRFLQPILDKAIDEHLLGFKSVFSYFLVKNPHKTKKVAIHQDWTLTDERNYQGLTVWVPLVDTTINNGNFHVLPGSHLLFQNIRGTNIEMPYSHIGDQIEEKLLQPLPLNAGDAVLFDHRLVHFSPPNMSEDSRVAVGHTLLPAGAPMYHYFKENPEDEQIFRQRVEDSFLLDYSFKESLQNYFKGEKEQVSWRTYQLSYPFFFMKYTLGKLKGLLR